MSDSTPYDLIRANSPAQAEALTHPTRHRIMRAIGPHGATISQLANRLRVNKGNVAHHLGVLARAGLVRKGATRTVRGGTEQYFFRTARKYAFGPGDGGVAFKVMLATIADEIVETDDHLLNLRTIRLTARQARVLREQLESLVDELDPANPPETEYGVLVSLYRRPDRI